MAHFEWTPELETGNETIDGQHRSLFDLANAVQATLESDAPDGDIIADAVWRLADYVIEHFNDEQDLMEASGYPELPVHKALHDQLTGETMRFTAQLINEDHLAAGDLSTLVIRWLRDHIGEADKRFVAYLPSHDS